MTNSETRLLELGGRGIRQGTGSFIAQAETEKRVVGLELKVGTTDPDLGFWQAELLSAFSTGRWTCVAEEEGKGESERRR